MEEVNVDPNVSIITQTRTENELIGNHLTPEGMREIRWRGGQEVEVDPLNFSIEPFQGLHKKFRDKHRQSLMAFMQAVAQVKEAGRDIPVLREELLQLQFNKQVIKDLIQFGLLIQYVIPIKKGSVNLGGRAVLVPTLEARKLTRDIEHVMREQQV